MIIDKIENITLYGNLNARFKVAIEYLEETDIAGLKPGKYEIVGDEIFILVNEYETKPAEDCILEAHKKYIDFQLMLSGNEQIAYAPLFDQKPIEEYNTESDYALYRPGNLSDIKLAPKMFAVFFPNDLHMPGIISGEKERIKKAVVKILI